MTTKLGQPVRKTRVAIGAIAATAGQTSSSSAATTRTWVPGLRRSMPESRRPRRSIPGGRRIGRWARGVLQDSLGPRFRTYRIGPMAERPVNNARVIAARLYRTHLDWFEAWHRRHGGDVRAGVAGLAELVRGAEGDSAFARLERALAGAAPVP